MIPSTVQRPQRVRHDPSARTIRAAARRMIPAQPPQADAIVTSARATIDRQLEAIGEATAASHWVMLLSAAALIPLTALLTFGFSVAVTRPLRMLGQAIAALGRGRYEQRIEIAYSADDVQRIAASGKLVAAIGIENGYSLGRDLEMLERYYELGARYLGLVHDGDNDLARSARIEDDT